MTTRARTTAKPQRTRTLLDSALKYAHAGWKVLPLRPRGKQPLTPHGVNDATTDPDTIRRWWRRWPNANIGLAIPLGFLVVDLDSPEALQRLRADDLSLPTTVDATTGRGRHLWYSIGTATVRNRVALFPGVDIRTAGGYVVAPPSIHPSGAVYRWKVPLERSAIAECPEWLLDRLSANSTTRGRSSDAWHRKIAAPVPEGRRNQTLAEVAGLLFRRLPAQAAAELAFCWAQVKLHPPLSEKEVLQTINSIAGCESRRSGVGQ